MMLGKDCIKNVFSKVLSPAVVVLLASLAIRSSIRTLNGCDFIHLQFEALNDNNIYFKDTSTIGLGFQSHQPMKGKNAYAWVNNNTCLPYDDIESVMFYNDIEISGAEQFFTQGLIILCVATAIIVLNICAASYFISASASTCNVCNTIVLYFSTGLIYTSSHLQRFAYESLSHENTEICSRHRYWPDEWYENYPLFQYPDYKYMKFFAECQMGETSLYALDAIHYQRIACIWILCFGSLTLLYKFICWFVKQYQSGHVGRVVYKSIRVLSGGTSKAEDNTVVVGHDKHDDGDDDNIHYHDEEANKTVASSIEADSSDDEESV